METHPLPSIFNRQSAIVNEFQEPLRDVVAGFIPLGMTCRTVAETLEVDPRSLRSYCRAERIQFPRYQPDRAERIRETKRKAAPRLALGRERRTLGEWAELAGIKKSTLCMRLKRGWTLSDALRA